MSMTITDPYQDKIDECKAPKAWSKVKRILQYLILGARNGYTSSVIADKLNTRGVKPLVSDRWTSHNCSMALMFMARLEEKSSLGRGMAYLLKTGDATDNDLFLLRERTRK